MFFHIGSAQLQGKFLQKKYPPELMIATYYFATRCKCCIVRKELRTRGWLEENISRLDKLLWAHAIRAEEYYGIGFCTENLEYSTHASSDIRRHSSMDNYSCELYERAILRHKKQNHNSKGLEKTFAV